MLMGSIEHGHVLHVLINVPWVRLDEVKAVVHNDPADPVILGLGAVVLASVVVHSCIAVASSLLNRLINFHRFGIRACACSTCCSTPTYLAVGVRLLGNNAANHTPKPGVEPELDPPVTAKVRVASVEGLDVVDPLVGSVADAFLIACEECVDACVGKQSDVVVANNFSRSQRGENF